jgi:hypothetical protein
MKGHGEKHTRKTETAIVALLTQPTLGEAAKNAGIGESTLWRWLQEPEFNQLYRESRQQALTQAICRLQQVASQAVDCLAEIIANEDAPTSSRVTASKAVLELALKATETEDLISRIEALERITAGGMAL